jgi:hypothetical protein
MNPLIRLKQTSAVFLATFGLACFGLSPVAHGVTPAPDGGYPGGNTAEGQAALLSLTTGNYNTAIGAVTLRANTTGQVNTAVGFGALLRNRIASLNTATGALALFNNDSTGNDIANWNSAFGASALFSNTDGIQNSAFGESALYSNTTGNYNTAIGDNALRLNQTGIGNTAVGYFALHNNTADGSTAVGYGALASNTSAINNTALGAGALNSNTTGFNNTAVGRSALQHDTGPDNTAHGASALSQNTTGGSNTAVGAGALVLNTTGNFNVAIGSGAGLYATAGSYNVYIGAGMLGVAGESNACYIASIFGQSVDPATGTSAFVDTNGKLGTVLSSRRFKHDIQPMNKASEAILGLNPVTFHYKSDAKNTPCFGLIAEDVAAVDPNLVVRDKNGELMSVRYDQVNAMLLNEFLKEHKTVQEQGATIARLEKQIETLTAGLQKVSAQLELSKAAPQTVLNNQ